MQEIALSRALGWFSIGLGIAELVAARHMAHALGRPEAETLIRGFGAREVATGVVILSNPAGPGGLWARVAGDAADLAGLGVLAADEKNRKRDNAALALVGVAGITLLDIATAQALQTRSHRALATAERTRVRGLDRPAEGRRPIPATARNGAYPEGAHRSRAAEAPPVGADAF